MPFNRATRIAIGFDADLTDTLRNMVRINLRESWPETQVGIVRMSHMLPVSLRAREAHQPPSHISDIRATTLNWANVALLLGDEAIDSYWAIRNSARVALSRRSRGYEFVAIECDGFNRDWVRNSNSTEIIAFIREALGPAPERPSWSRRSIRDMPTNPTINATANAWRLHVPDTTSSDPTFTTTAVMDRLIASYAPSRPEPLPLTAQAMHDRNIEQERHLRHIRIAYQRFQAADSRDSQNAHGAYLGSSIYDALRAGFAITPNGDSLPELIDMRTPTPTPERVVFDPDRLVRDSAGEVARAIAVHGRGSYIVTALMDEFSRQGGVDMSVRYRPETDSHEVRAQYTHTDGQVHMRIEQSSAYLPAGRTTPSR